MYKETIKTAGEKMDKTLSVIQKDLSTLRAGRANPQILDKITVDYYGTPTPLNQVGNISSPEPRMLVIAPWEPKMIGPIWSFFFHTHTVFSFMSFVICN